MRLRTLLSCDSDFIIYPQTTGKAILMDHRSLLQLIMSAWRKVSVDHPIDHHERSNVWIDALARSFEEQYCQKYHRVFWQRNCNNEASFNVRELLFDILVCDIGTIHSFQSKSKPLEYIAKCHWQIECEFNKSNSRNVIVDMSKLVAGSATHKLFITSRRNNDRRTRATESALLERLQPIAESCRSALYFCFVEHPEKWSREPRLPALHKLTDTSWKHITTENR